MLNAEKYKEAILRTDYNFSLQKNGYIMQCTKLSCNECQFQGRKSCVKAKFRWLLEEYKGPILTEEEKKIILNIIDAFKPFGDELKCIAKYCCNDDPKEYYLNFSYRDHDDLDTFSFNGDELFVGMEVDELYSLEELGL